MLKEIEIRCMPNGDVLVFSQGSGRLICNKRNQRTPQEAKKVAVSELRNMKAAGVKGLQIRAVLDRESQSFNADGTDGIRIALLNACSFLGI